MQGLRLCGKNLSSILYLTNVLPYPLDAGPKVRAYHTLQYLAQTRRVTLLSFVRPSDTPEAIQHLSTICECVVTILIRRSRLGDLRALVNSLLTGRSFFIARDHFPAMSQAVAALVQRHQFDFVHADQISMAEYGLEARVAAQHAHYPVPPRLILDLHNAFYLIPQRMAESSSNPLLRSWLGQESKRVARYEADIARAYDKLVTVTREDRDALLALYPNGDSPSFTVIPICMDTAALAAPSDGATPVELPTLTRDPNILFIGGLHWPPNAEGVTWFARDVLPIIQSNLPNATFTAVGKNPPSLTGPGLSTPGYVEDANPYWANGRVFIVPLKAGGGMRVKIVEAWARGLPVVSTTIGAEGIDYTDGENILIADTPQAFAAAVSRLLTDDSLAAALSRAGRAAVETLYDWRTAYKAWDTIYAI